MAGGDASCSIGHHGPLCGACDDGYYRASGVCEPCPDAQGEGSVISRDATFVVWALASVGFFAVIILYLRSSTRRFMLEPHTYATPTPSADATYVRQTRTSHADATRARVHHR